jgi:hypothetical protein
VDARGFVTAPVSIAGRMEPITAIVVRKRDDLARISEA